jgi:hypothetical protein
MLTFLWSTPNEEDLRQVQSEPRTFQIQWYDPNCSGDDLRSERETVAPSVRRRRGDDPHVERCGVGASPRTKAR